MPASTLLLLLACGGPEATPPPDDVVAEATPAVAPDVAGDPLLPEEAGEERKRRRKRNKDNTPAFERFSDILGQDFEPHVIGDPSRPPPPRATPVPGGAEPAAFAVADQLAALGYVDGEVEAEAGSADGVRHHDPARAFQGYTLLTMGGHETAILIDMAGREVWRWTFTLQDAWPSFQRKADEDAPSYRRAQLLPNGDLVVLWSGYGIARITKDSRLVWGNFLPVHHDLEVLPDGSVITLTRVVHDLPRIAEKQPIIEDFVTWLDPTGAVVGSLSVLEAFEAYPRWKAVWEARPKRDQDLFHTNALTRIDRDVPGVPAFRTGNLLLSMRHLEVVAVLDPAARQIVWSFDDVFSRQHDPTLVGADHLLVFDNHGGPGETSRLLEYDLRTGKLAWSYAGTPPSAFATGVCGGAQRLPNGNTLANESTRGRAFEVTPAGDVVWDYRTPFRTTGSKRLVSRLEEVTRVPPGFVETWLKR